LITLTNPLRDMVLRHLDAGDRFAIAAPALTEARFGIGLLPRARQNVEQWGLLKFRFDYYDIDRLDAEQAAELQLSLRRQGWQLETVDALIATAALRHNLTLLTTDKGFRAISTLEQENWLV
jgi:predicted nucleic acid-binding protein